MIAEGRMAEATTRWTVSVSRRTDREVRRLLARRGLRQGDLSTFIEEAVKRRVLEETLADARAGFADLPSEEAERLIAEAVAATRQAPA